MKQKINRLSGVLGFGVVLAALAACNQKSEPDPKPEPSPNESDASRSIFDEDAPGVQETATPDAVLQPLKATIGFPDKADELTEVARSELVKVMSSPQMEKGDAIILRGHSDSGGNDAVNLRISETRAETVRDFLLENGVDEKRITIIAFGEQNPVKPNALADGSPNEAGRAANRRVELIIKTGAKHPEETREPTLVESLTKSKGEQPASKTAKSDTAGQ